jgi:drug/metabolite transporter (DMT)-like permease
MTQREREVRIGIACALVVLVIWTAFILISRAGMRGTMTPFDLAALRFSFAGAALFPVFLRRGMGELNFARFAAIGSIAGIGYALVSYSGFVFAPASHGAVLLSGTQPLISAALGYWLLGERIDRRRTLGLALVLLGVALVGLQSMREPAAGSWRGDLLFLAGAGLWSLYGTLARKWHLHPIDAILAGSIFTSVAYLPVYLAFLPTNLATTPWREIVFQGVYQGIFAVVIAMVAYTQVVRTFGPVRTAMITAIVPGTAALLSVPLLGEPLAPLTLAGAAFTTLGMFVGLLRARR